MTAIRGHDYDIVLLALTERLIRDDDTEAPAGQIIAAVVRAKLRVRDSYAGLPFDPPPPDEYAALVAGLAKQDLVRAVGLPTG